MHKNASLDEKKDPLEYSRAESTKVVELKRGVKFRNSDLKVHTDLGLQKFSSHDSDLPVNYAEGVLSLNNEFRLMVLYATDLLILNNDIEALKVIEEYGFLFKKQDLL